MGAIRRFLYEHSFSLTMAAGFVISEALTLRYAPGTRWYDFWNGMASNFGGAFFIVVAGRYTYERDADPTKPPKP